MTQLLGVAKSERTGSRSGYRSAPATTSSPGDPRGAHRAAHTPLLPRLPAAYPVSPRVHGNGVDPDGTDLNFVEHPGCVGLGLISRNKGSAGTLGIHTHSTLVANGEGIPLGVPQIQYEAPDGKAEQGKPLEERKTMRWIRGLRECAELAQQLQGVRPVSVMDREGDVYAIFAEQRRLGTVDLVVRAQHDRVLGKGEPKLFEAVRKEAAQGRLEIHVARQSARRSSRGQKGRQAREERVAEVALRCHHGCFPCDRALGMARTDLSPGVTRMTGAAAALVSFAQASGLLDDLAGVRVGTKHVQRTAEALGRESAARERHGPDGVSGRGRHRRPGPGQRNGWAPRQAARRLRPHPRGQAGRRLDG